MARIGQEEAVTAILHALKLGLSSYEWAHLHAFPSYDERYWDLAIAGSAVHSSASRAVDITRALGIVPSGSLMMEVDRAIHEGRK